MKLRVNQDITVGVIVLLHYPLLLLIVLLLDLKKKKVTHSEDTNLLRTIVFFFIESIKTHNYQLAHAKKLNDTVSHAYSNFLTNNLSGLIVWF